MVVLQLATHALSIVYLHSDTVTHLWQGYMAMDASCDYSLFGRAVVLLNISSVYYRSSTCTLVYLSGFNCCCLVVQVILPSGVHAKIAIGIEKSLLIS